MNKIGILGGGQLGHRLFEMFKADMDNVRLYTRSCGFDLSDLSILDEIVEENDFIINCIAMTNVDACEEDVCQAMHLNAILPSVLAAAACRKHKKIVHISSVDVYGDVQIDGDEILENSEELPSEPLSIYGKTKLAGDLSIMNNVAAEEYALILRPSWLFDYESTNSMIARLYDSILTNERVEAAGDIYGVPTECSLLYRPIVEFMKGELPAGCYNIRNSMEDDEETPTIFSIASYMAEYLCCPEKVVEMSSDDVKTSPKTQHNCTLDISEICGCLFEHARPRLYVDIKTAEFMSNRFRHWKDAIREFLAINILKQKKSNTNDRQIHI